jgi:hypothetical protein
LKARRTTRQAYPEPMKSLAEMKQVCFEMMRANAETTLPWKVEIVINEVFNWHFP